MSRTRDRALVDLRGEVRSSSKTVILATHGIGDTLMVQPTVGGIVRVAGGEVIVLVRSWTEADLLRDLNVECIPIIGVGTTSVARILVKLRRRGVGALVSTFNVSPRKAAWVSRVLGARVTVGFSRLDVRARFDVCIHPAGMHKIDENARLLTLLGITKDPGEPRWKVREDEQSEAGCLIGNHRASGPLITLAPGSNPSEAFKRWPLDRYVDLVERLLECGDVRFIVLGGPLDAVLGSELVARAPTGAVLNLAGALPLKASASVLAGSDLLLSGDCGLAHLAAALGTRTVVLAGPTLPHVTCARGPNVTTLSSGMWCVGCYERELRIDPKCEAPICMQWHQTDSVLDVLVKVTQRLGAARF